MAKLTSVPEQKEKLLQSTTDYIKQYQDALDNEAFATSARVMAQYKGGTFRPAGHSTPSSTSSRPAPNPHQYISPVQPK